MDCVSSADGRQLKYQAPKIPAVCQNLLDLVLVNFASSSSLTLVWIRNVNEILSWQIHFVLYFCDIADTLGNLNMKIVSDF